MCLSAGRDAMLVAEHAPLASVLEAIKKEAELYRRQAASLRNLTLLYGRYLRARELSWLDQLQRDLDALTLHPGLGVSDDTMKIGLLACLEGMGASSRALFQSFALPIMLDEVDRYTAEVNKLKRKWDVPGIRKRMGKSLAPLFDAEHPNIASKLREEAEESDSPPAQA